MNIRIGSLEIVAALAVFGLIAVRPRELRPGDIVDLTPMRIHLDIFEHNGRSTFDGVCPVVVGRSHEATLPIMDAEISRRHARFEAQNGIVYVSDLGSRNGTFLNGQSLDGAIEVRPGDTIDVGTTRLVFSGSSKA